MAESLHDIKVVLNGTTMDRAVEKIAYVTEKHHLGDGAYCRWLWQNDKQTRQLGINEYGCADAINILYTIGRLPRANDPMKQKMAVEASVEEMRQPENMRGKTDLEAALSELPDKYRLPIVLYYMEDYSTRTIAGMLEIPEGRLRERMRTARKMLGRLLKHESD